MATYAIGDIHGCWRTFELLLRRIEFSARHDTLWFTGDVVRHGGGSLEILRWLYEHRHRVSMVLGNHDLYLLAWANGLIGRPEPELERVVTAPDGERLLSWLRQRPLLIAGQRQVLVHAGLMPGWSLAEAQELAVACSRWLRSPTGIAEAYSKRKTVWRSGLCEGEQVAAALAVLTRIRVVGADGTPQLQFTGPLGQMREGSRPWFEDATVCHEGYRVLFGHWAMLGLVKARTHVCLDSSCVWGGHLTALRLEDDAVFEEPLADQRREL